MDTDQNPAGGADQIPQTLTIGDREYSVEEAQELIGLGSKTRELESQYNTKLDRVWPEYGRLSQEHKTLKTQYDKAQADLSAFQQKTQSGQQVTTDEVEQAKAAARKMGIPFMEDIEKAGYVRKDDLSKEFSEYYKTEREKEKAVERIISQAESLEKEIDGSDGRPKFRKGHVLAYASAYQIQDLKKAYEQMYPEELKSWSESQVKTVQKPGLRTIKPAGGAKSPAPKEITWDNAREAIAETMWKE